MKKSDFKIDSHIPYPDKRVRRHEQRKYRFSEMKVGDSFSTGIKYKHAGDSDIQIRILSNAARNWKNINHPNWKFSTAKMPNGTVRIWRIK